MTGVLRYLTHPEVAIDPAVPVPDWGLSDRGRARVLALAARGWPAGTGRIASSAERKAAETAGILAAALGLQVEHRPAQGEIDRSATGYVPHERHEALADRFFADPDQSAEGWETARAAGARVLADLEALLARHGAGRGAGDLLVVGHGGVGTLLYCHFAGLPPARRHDQPAGGGCVFALDLATRRPSHGWRRAEDL
ncbi:MAG: phosphoglycerate mutase family protein [Rhodobacteraceae bacterium]|nr:phosphoglycerate mutase family protein [Paracoccaceae bacterium]